MPSVSDLGSSKYLKQTDVNPDLVVTISGYDLVNMAKEGETKEMKYCLTFQGDVKPLSLNKTNGELIELNLGSGNFDDWIGRQITLYADPTIMCKGQRTGGIRVRYYAPQQQAPAQAPPSQFTADNNLANNPPRTDDTGPLPEPPPF